AARAASRSLPIERRRYRRAVRPRADRRDHANRQKDRSFQPTSRSYSGVVQARAGTQAPVPVLRPLTGHATPRARPRWLLAIRSVTVETRESSPGTRNFMILSRVQQRATGRGGPY